MNKEKISKALCIIVIIILFFAGISQFASSYSMTLKEYDAQRNGTAAVSQ